MPPIPGARENLATGGVVTSDTIWNLAAPPKKLGIVGGGVIGVEMAQIFRDFGTEVLMLERHDRILAEIEDEIAKTLIASLEKEITVVTGAAINEVSGQPGAMKLRYANKEGVESTFDCDIVLMATGKRPDTSKLNLDKVGVELDGAAIKVNTRGQTSVPHIYAVGDVIGGRIIGVHYLADHTDTLIGIGVMMVAGEMTLTQVAKAIFPHPTQTELFGELARRLLNRMRRTAKK